MISGSGFAIAKTIGFSDIDLSISTLIISDFDNPIKTSAPFNASSKLLTFIFLVINSFFSFDKLSLLMLIGPLLSNMIILSFLTPNATYILAHEIAAAPAPQITILIFLMSFFASSRAFIRAAPEIIAVPCWSSCITGIFSSSTSLLSISKASGALISSKFIPPKVGAIFLTVCINWSISFVSTSISKTSISANILNKRPLPSITGFDANGPISPNPKTAVPLEITATRFDLEVYLYTSSGFWLISKHGYATPGEYAKDKSLWVWCFLVGSTFILPGLGLEWYTNAFLLSLSWLILFKN